MTKEEAQETKPTEKPEPIGDTTNKGEVPSYPEEVPVTAPEVQAPADNSESSHPGQVYDPDRSTLDPFSSSEITVCVLSETSPV